jgi:diguanylate cyclase (GGDEF)-like protein/PAS domain S-box-containing protein
MLYIEDNEIVAVLIQERLSQDGCIVDIAEDGETGLAKLKECQYDIVAVDYHLLPNMDGLQVLQKLQEIGFNKPTIMITGEGNEEIAVAAMKLGVSDYLIKDTENKYFKKLSSVLRNAIEKHRLMAEKTQAENALLERDAILEAVSFAAEQFLTASRWAQPIQAVLARLGRAANASRSYIFKNHTNFGHDYLPALLMSPCYEWVADGITPQIDNPDLQNLPYYPLFGRWAQTLCQGQAIQGLVRDFPDAEILLLTAQHIISIVILPIFVGKNWWGFMRYDYCVEERQCSPVVLDALKTAARILGAAIQQEQTGLALLKSEQQVQTFIDTAEDLIYFRTLAGVPTPLNAAYTTITGYSCEEFQEKWQELTHPEDLKRLNTFFSSHPQGTPSFETEYRLRTKEGQWRWIHSRMVGSKDQNDAYIGYNCIGRDITKRKLAEEALQKSQIRLIQAQRLAHLGSWERNLVTKTLRWSEETYRIFGLPPDDNLPREETFFQAIHPEDVELVQQALAQTLYQHEPYQIEFRIIRPDGKVRYVTTLAEVTRNAEDQPISIFGVLQDITERKQAEELIWRQANYDALTNLPNRSFFTNRLALAISTAKRTQERVALLFIDLDRFKWVNDTFGHKAGDLLLQEAAQRFTHCVRESDTVARLAGDEFTVVLLNLEDVLNARKIAERILESLSQPFMLDNHEVSISGSIGITCFPDDGQEVETLLKNADTAMYQAKESGRNTFRFFTAEMNFQASEHLRLKNALPRALERSQFVLHYQPIINLASGQLMGAESLICWQPPQQELVLPNQFMSLAEDMGLIIPIGQWGLRAVVQQLQDWHDIGLTFLQLTITVSPRQLRSSQFLELVTTVLNNTKLPPHSLIFEVTENTLLETLPETITTLCQLGGLGVQIAIDDYGIGGVFFYYLKQIPIHFLKIDQTFIQDVTSNNYNAILLETIITLAHKLNLKVISEGVETREQLEFLRSQGCDLAQGYYFSKPLSCEGFEQFAKSKS